MESHSEAVEGAIKNQGRKCMEELPEAQHTKAAKEGNFTSCSLPDIPIPSAMHAYKQFSNLYPFSQM